MILLESEKTTQKYAKAQTISEIFDYKDVTRLLKRFRDFADDNPGYFDPVVPFIQNKGMSRLYNVYCFAHFFEDMDLTESGRRNFREDLDRLKEVY